MVISDKRCEYCNWLNKEVKNVFVCKNCGKENGKEMVEDNTQYNSKRRNK